MKLFQIEEPEGAPLVAAGPGAAVGVELSAAKGAAVALSVGGNAELLAPRQPSPPLEDAAGLRAVLLDLRSRAEKALARPVTHAVIALAADADASAGARVAEGAATAGLSLLSLIEASAAAALAPGGGADAVVLGAAVKAEDDMAPLLAH
jgi:hypothetical protein